MASRLSVIADSMVKKREQESKEFIRNSLFYIQADEDDVTIEYKTNSEDVLEKYYHIILTIANNDFCFCGTLGELAFRIIATLLEDSYTPLLLVDDPNYNIPNIIKNDATIMNEVLSTFKGVFFGYWYIRDIKDANSLMKTELNVKCVAGRLTFGDGSGREILNVTYETPEMQAASGERDCVWVSIDGTAAGIGLPNVYAATRTIAIIDTQKHRRAKEILMRLAWLDTDKISFMSTNRLIENLRFGANFGNFSNRICSIVAALPGSNKPSHFFDQICFPNRNRFHNSDFGRELGDINSDDDIVIVEMWDQNCEEKYIAWGEAGELSKETASRVHKVRPIWVKLTLKYLILLFGPPLYILQPLKPNHFYKISEVFRFSDYIYKYDPLSPKTLRIDKKLLSLDLGKYLDNWGSYFVCRGDPPNKYKSRVIIQGDSIDNLKVINEKTQKMLQKFQKYK